MTATQVDYWQRAPGIQGHGRGLCPLFSRPDELAAVLIFVPQLRTCHDRLGL
jgi:hypothetical protein